MWIAMHLKRLSLLPLVWCSMGVLAAAPLCIEVGPITLDRLLAGGDLAGGCIIEDKLFDNFSYSVASQGGGATVPAASGITVTPLVTPLNPGLQFTALWAAGPGAFADSTLGYAVSVQEGGNAITDASLLMAGGHVGTGIAAIDEVLCVGDTFTGGCANGVLVTLNTLSSAVGVFSFDSESFGPVTVVDVVKDIGVVGGVDGVATVSTFQQRYSEEAIPEPLTFLLTGGGLLVLGVLRRRR